MKYFITLSFFLACVAPLSVSASVRINEIAWMGTTISANDEWIELYNDESGSVSLDGWTLSDGVSFSVPLAGTIGAGAYAVLERTDDTTVEGTAFLIYTGALANDGRTLTLTRSDGATEDEVVGGSNWESIGGDNTTKETAQRTLAGWITATATPGAVNAVIGSNNATDDTDNDDEDDSNTETASSNSSSRNSSASNSGSLVKKEDLPDVLSLSIRGPKIAYVNQSVSFEALPSGVGKTIANSLLHTWNFGDTYTASGKTVEHIFTYPGEYVVVVNGAFAKQSAMVRHEITVLPVSFELSKTVLGDARVKNSSPHEVDLGGFTMEGSRSFTFPPYTILKAGGTLTVPKIRFGASASVSLSDAQKVRVAYVAAPVQSAVTYASAPTFATRTIFSGVSSDMSDEREEKPSEIIPPSPSPESQVIQIGTVYTTESEGGAVTRFFRTIARFFNL